MGSDDMGWVGWAGRDVAAWPVCDWMDDLLSLRGNGIEQLLCRNHDEPLISRTLRWDGKELS